MNKIIGKIITLGLALAAVASISVSSVWAATEQTGSVTVITGTDAKDEELTLYDIGTYSQAEYSLNEDFAETGIDFESIKTSEDAGKAVDKLQECIKENPSIKGISAKINENGQAVFKDLDADKTYLILQTNKPVNAEIQGALVTVPYLNDGKYEYDITVTAKYKTDINGDADVNGPDADNSHMTGIADTSTIAPNEENTWIVTGDDIMRYVITGIVVAVSLGVIIALGVTSRKKKSR